MPATEPYLIYPLKRIYKSNATKLLQILLNVKTSNLNKKEILASFTKCNSNFSFVSSEHRESKAETKEGGSHKGTQCMGSEKIK